MGNLFWKPPIFDSLKSFFGMCNPKMARKMRVSSMPKKVNDFFHKIFLQALDERQLNGVDRNDFVQMLLDLKDKFSPTEMAAEVFLIYVAAFETSATAMSFALYELALNQEIQNRLRNEIKVGIEENDGKFTYEIFSSFKYLNMIINESLRKYPPIPNIFRKATNNFNIPNTSLNISKGTLVELNIFSFHRDPEYFSQPEKFDPERFSDENIEKIRPNTFLPFGSGPRYCLGERLGILQAKVGLAKLIQNFTFLPCKKTTIPMKFDPKAFVTAPINGIFLNVQKNL